MPAEVKILITGITNADAVLETGEEHTEPTVTLVRDGSIVMVVDPGIMVSQQILVDALKKENLTVNDVNCVCVTHSHMDHYRNIGMFPVAKTIDYWGIWFRNTVEPWSEDFTENIRILHTPGHDYTGITLFVTTKEGVVAICGDVFWKENYPQDAHDDAFASNPERLKDSREMVLETADWIIPGHSGMYKSSRKDAQAVEPVPQADDYKVKKDEPRVAVTCKICGKDMKQKDKCGCRPYLCFRCCECGLDCDFCSCSHRKKSE